MLVNFYEIAVEQTIVKTKTDECLLWNLPIRRFALIKVIIYHFLKNVLLKSVFNLVFLSGFQVFSQIVKNGHSRLPI